MKKTLTVGFLILVVAIAMAISGCTAQKQQPVGNNVQTQILEVNSSDVQAQPPAVNPAGNLGIKADVEISSFSFIPGTLTVPRGATVIWTNMDSVSHTVVSDSGSEINSDSIAKGETYAHTFNKAGTYDYHCSIHPSMTGKIIVE